MSDKGVEMYVLCGDVGGTNSRLQLHGAAAGAVGVCQATEHVFQSADFASLGGLVSAFLEKIKFGGVIDSACIAVCGPVENEQHMSGPVLPEQPPTQWDARSSDLVTGELKGRVLRAVLVNDFIAIGLGLKALPPDDLVTLHDAPAEPNAPIACVGAGTGLGEVYLTWEDKAQQYRAWSSEGGMTAFCPQTDQEWALRKFCVAQNGHATVESVVSGPGLRNTFNYLVSTGQHDAISPGISLDDLPQAISTAALAGTDAVAVEALTLMMRAWAAECQSISLRVMPFGGLYLAGGLTPKLISAIRETLVPEFLEGNPLMASIHKRCPLYAVMNESVGLLGAKVRAVQLLTE